MKTRHLLPLVAGLLFFSAGLAAQAATAAKAVDNVTVTFQDPDKFTDVRENQSTTNSTYYLDELRNCLQTSAAPLLAAGQKLAITVTDIDLAGDTLFNQPNQIRVMKDIYAPRAQLKFQLLDAGGKVVKEGERKLVNRDYMLQIRMAGNSDPLYYDKQLLQKWAQDEFKTKS